MSKYYPSLPNQSIEIKPYLGQDIHLIMSQSVSSFNVSGLKEIPKLPSGNIVLWKQGLKFHLKMNGLYSFIECSYDCPTSSPDCDAFDMRQAAVLHAIRSTVNEANRATIDSLDNPKVSYDTLVVQHGRNDGFTAANTLTELSSTRYNPDTSMIDYLAKTQALHSRVCDRTSGDLDLKISDKLFAVVLVNSLPRAKCSTVIQQLLVGIKTLSTAQVIARLCLEASSIASDEERFKDIYVAKNTKINSRKVGN